jgi:GNAT superfamily N-acetyltransferase
MITLDDRADPEFWTPAEQAEPALYLHRMVVARSASGHRTGRLLLDWAVNRAADVRQALAPA